MLAIYEKNDSAMALLLEKGAAVNIANNVSACEFPYIRKEEHINFRNSPFVVVGWWDGAHACRPQEERLRHGLAVGERGCCRHCNQRECI